jgi:hypothetical protein
MATVDQAASPLVQSLHLDRSSFSDFMQQGLRTRINSVGSPAGIPGVRLVILNDPTPAM